MYAAGFDLAALIDGEAVAVAPGQNIIIHTGIAVEPPKGYFGAVFARSGLSTRNGLRPATCVSVIDWDYRGEITVPLYNDSNEAQMILDGERIAQLVFIPYLTSSLEEVAELCDTVRGEAGYGSTGTNEDQIPGQMTIFDYADEGFSKLKALVESMNVLGSIMPS